MVTPKVAETHRRERNDDQLLLGYMLSRHEAELREYFALPPSEAYNSIYRRFQPHFNGGRDMVEFCSSMQALKSDATRFDIPGNTVSPGTQADLLAIDQFVKKNGVQNSLSVLKPFFGPFVPWPPKTKELNFSVKPEPNPAVAEFMAQQQPQAPTVIETPAVQPTPQASYCVFWNVGEADVAKLMQLGTAAGFGVPQVVKS